MHRAKQNSGRGSTRQQGRGTCGRSKTPGCEKEETEEKGVPKETRQDTRRQCELGAGIWDCSEKTGNSGQPGAGRRRRMQLRSEEHTSELQSQFHLVCRL